MSKTKEQLLASAEEIRTNTAPNSNTADLVGSTLKDMINKSSDDKDELQNNIDELSEGSSEVISSVRSDLSSEVARAKAAENAAAAAVTAEKTRAKAAESALNTILTGVKSDMNTLSLVNDGVKYAGLIGIDDDTNKYAANAIPTDKRKVGLIVTYLDKNGNPQTYQFTGSNISQWLTITTWQGIDDVPTAGSDNLVKSGGVQEELALGAVYDVSAKNPTAGVNNDGKFESLSALLGDTNLNTLIPTSVRKGGMSIKFVQSSDNKYVQWRLMANEWSTNTEDWAIADEGVYVENPEFVYVKADNEGKILWAIKTDGDIYYGAGCPQQVKDYIEEKISALSLDEYEDIVAFLDEIINKRPIFSNKKVSIIGDSISTFAGYIPDGYPSWYPHDGDRASDVVSVNDTWWKKLIDATNSTLEVNASYSGSTASSLVEGFSPRVPLLGKPDVILVALGTNDSWNSIPIGDVDFDAESYDLTQFAPAYIKGIKDIISRYPYARIICLAFDMGIEYQDTIKTIAEYYGIEYIYVGDISDVHPNKAEMQAVYEKIYNTYTLNGLLANKVDKEEGKSLINAEYAEGVHYIENPEFAEVKVDNEDRILEAIMKDGTKLLPAGVKVIGTAEYDGATIKTVENPEFAGVWLANEERILFGVQTNGNFFFGCGVPKQVKEYIEQKIEELSLDEYESIVAFIGDYLNNTTLEELLSKKVDGEYMENPEYIEAKIDAEDKILEATDKDGTKIFSGDVKVLGSINISDVNYKVVSNPEWLEVVLDEQDRIICGIKSDGKFVVYVADFLDDIEVIKARLEELDAYSITENPEFMEVELDVDDKIIGGRKVDGTKFENNDVEFNGNAAVGGSLEVDGVVIKNSEDPENRIEMTLDAKKKIVSYRKVDGTLVENAGIETHSLKVLEDIELGETPKNKIESDIKASLNMPYMIKKFNLPDYGSIDIICELFYLGTDNKEYNPTKVTKVNNIWYVTKTLTEVIDPETGEKSYEVNENSIATTYTEIDVDMEDTTRWPVDKTKHYCKVAMKFGDIDGTWYATVAFQGASTLTLPKKGLRITPYKKSDFAKKDKIKIGEMIVASKYNVKAYYGDPTRLRDVVLQRLIIEARNLRDYSEQYPWNNEYPVFTGAVGTIQSFPVKLTTSGNFYGVSMMGLAKDEHNFMLDGDDTGMLISGDYVGTQYPLSFAEFHPETWTDEMNDVKEGEHTPSNLTALTAFWDWINNGEWNKTTVPQHMSVIDWIDYYIFVQVFRMRDNDIHNIILYTKADKVKFYAFLYDLDLSWGNGYNYDMPIDEESLILWKKFVTLYWDEIVERYKSLRSTILNYEHASNIIASIQASIPYSDFEAEMKKWNEVNYTDATKRMLNNFKSCLVHFDEFFK